MNYDELIKKAKDVSKNAYSKYSHFSVGACVVGESGETYSGCNFENASFGLTICAERNAIGSAIANGEKSIKAVALYSPNSEDCLPCGACRQVIWEFCKDDVIIITEVSGKPKIRSIKELLPLGFK